MEDPYRPPDAVLAEEHDVELTYVGFWVRAAATIIDSLLLLVIIMPLGMAMYGMDYLVGETLFYGPADLVLNYLLPAVVVLVFWHYKSATPGKMLFGARIVDIETGDPPSTGQFIGRYFGYIPSALVFGLGYLWVAWDDRKQAWHDKWAKTAVVKATPR